MRLALITDTHAGARGGSKTFADYFDRFYYDVFFPYLKENNISQIIHLGDIVDKRKNMDYVVNSYLRKFMNTCDDMNIKLDVIIGNHDAPLKSSLKHNSMEELYSHSKYNVKYFDKPQVVNYDGLDIAMIPWICSGNYKESMDFIENTNADVLFGHLELQGFEMYRGSVNNHGLSASIFNKFSLVCSGHFHHKSSKGNINYLGSPFEITWGDWNDPRGFHIFDTDTQELTYIQNPYSIFHKIFYSQDSHIDLMQNLDIYKDSYTKVIVKDKDPAQFETFFLALEDVGLVDLQIIEDPTLDTGSVDIDIESVGDTKDLLTSYIDALDTKIDKKALHEVMGELYNEALAI